MHNFMQLALGLYPIPAPYKRVPNISILVLYWKAHGILMNALATLIHTLCNLTKTFNESENSLSTVLGHVTSS